jgi:DHA2 family multidrug resistance protein-like MFS transporter
MTSLSATAGLEPALLSGPRRAFAVTAVLSAMSAVVLDAGMANVALPSLARALGVAPAEAVAVMTAYQAGLVMALLPLGAVGERFGHRRVFTLSIAAFAMASVCAAIAPDIGWLVAARFVQGLGGAGVMALGMALLRFTVAQGHLGRAIAWNALTVALTTAAAPSVGALVLSIAPWRYLFVVTLPLTGLALASARALPPTARSEAPLRALSMVMSAAVFALLIGSAQTASSRPGLALALLGGAVVALGLLLRRERRAAAPLVPLDLLQIDSFRLSAIASVFCFSAQTAGMLALPFLLQGRLHLPLTVTGLCISVWPLSVAVAAALSGRLADRAPNSILCALGGATLAAGLAGCSIAVVPVMIILSIAMAGLGFGIFQTPNNRNLFLSAPPERSGAAGGMQGTARVAGQTTGALIIAMLLSGFALGEALRIGFAAAAALALAAGAVSALRSGSPRFATRP